MAPRAAPPRFGPKQLALAAAGAAAAALDVCADGWVAAEYARGGQPGWAALALALLAAASVATQACSWLWLRSDPPALRPDVPRWLLAALHLLQLGFLFRYGIPAPGLPPVPPAQPQAFSPPFPLRPPPFPPPPRLPLTRLLRGNRGLTPAATALPEEPLGHPRAPAHPSPRVDAHGAPWAERFGLALGWSQVETWEPLASCWLKLRKAPALLLLPVPSPLPEASSQMEQSWVSGQR